MRSARSVEQFEDVLPEAAPCVAYAPDDLDGQIGFVVDVLAEVYKLVRLVLHLAGCLYECYVMASFLPYVRTHMISLGLRYSETRRAHDVDDDHAQSF